MKDLKKLTRAKLIKIIKDFAKKQADPAIEQRILNAIDYAINLHYFQKPRPDGPYINHVLRVAALLILFGVTDPNIIIAALLHDSVEDQLERILDQSVPNDLRASVTVKSAYTVLDYKFGAVPAKLVEAVTNPDWSDIPEKTERNKLYVKHVKDLLEDDPEAALIKLSDFYDNGIWLSLIKDMARRKVLAEKYLPIFDIFIELAPKFTVGLISADILSEIIMEDLEIGRAYARDVLAA